MLEATTNSQAPEFRGPANEFLEWFNRLPKSSPNYKKLEEVRNILSKMLAV
jgi:hypothetical protein